MLDRLMPLIPAGARDALRALIGRPPAASTDPTIQPGFDARPAPMRPLHPPAATNDNPLEEIQEAVERELRARGHLR